MKIIEPVVNQLKPYLIVTYVDMSDSFILHRDYRELDLSEERSFKNIFDTIFDDIRYDKARDFVEDNLEDVCNLIHSYKMWTDETDDEELYEEDLGIYKEVVNQCNLNKPYEVIFNKNCSKLSLKLEYLHPEYINYSDIMHIELD